MKLLFCPDCGDVTQMKSQLRYCACKSVSGRYVDDEEVEVYGERAEVIGIDGHSVRGAVTLIGGGGKKSYSLDAWMLPHTAERVRRMGRRR